MNEHDLAFILVELCTMDEDELRYGLYSVMREWPRERAFAFLESVSTMSLALAYKRASEKIYNNEIAELKKELRELRKIYDRHPLKIFKN